GGGRPRRRDGRAADPGRGVAARVSHERVERYAELAVRVGANVQEGQEVFVNGAVEHADLVRALTRQSYRAGASYVNLRYTDQHVRRAMIDLGPAEPLPHPPPCHKTLAPATPAN